MQTMCSRCNHAIENHHIQFGVILCDRCEQEWEQRIPVLNELYRLYLERKLA